MFLLSSADIFQNQFSKKTFRNTIRVTNSLNPDQDRHFVGVLIWVHSVFKGYQQTTKIPTNKGKVHLNPD